MHGWSKNSALYIDVAAAEAGTTADVASNPALNYNNSRANTEPVSEKIRLVA